MVLSHLDISPCCRAVRCRTFDRRPFCTRLSLSESLPGCSLQFLRVGSLQFLRVGSLFGPSHVSVDRVRFI